MQLRSGNSTSIIIKYSSLFSLKISTDGVVTNGQGICVVHQYYTLILLKREAYRAMAEWLCLPKMERLKQFSKRMFKKQGKLFNGTDHSNNLPLMHHQENKQATDVVVLQKVKK